MVWVRIDDQFADHPKVLAAGPLAAWLYVCGLTYSSRLLTDGFIPSGQVRKLADVPNAQKLADALVRVGLWDEADGGYVIHDYLEYNPSRERTIATRESRAAAGSIGGKQKASKMLERSQAAASEMFKQNSTPSPSPTRTPEENTPPVAIATSPRGARAGRIPAQWPPEKHRSAMLELGQAYGLGCEETTDHFTEFHDYWSQATKNATSHDWLKRWELKLKEDLRTGRVGGRSRSLVPLANGRASPVTFEEQKQTNTDRAADEFLAVIEGRGNDGSRTVRSRHEASRRQLPG